MNKSQKINRIIHLINDRREVEDYFCSLFGCPCFVNEVREVKHEENKHYIFELEVYDEKSKKSNVIARVNMRKLGFSKFDYADILEALRNRLVERNILIKEVQIIK